MPKVFPLLAAALCALLLGCEVGTEQLPADQAASAGAKSDSSTGQAGAAGLRASRGNLNFVDGYQVGYQQALSSGKPMLVFFTAEWCHFCHQMANEAFTNAQVASLSQRFTCILVDADAEPEVCQQFHVEGYPTIQFLSPRGVPLNRLVGKKPGNQLMIAMQAALQNVARRADNQGTTIR